MAKDVSRRNVLGGAVASGRSATAALPRPMMRASLQEPRFRTIERANQCHPTSAPQHPGSTVAPRSPAQAKYAAEFNVPGLLHGYVVPSTITKGRIRSLDTSAALRVAGVIDVLTHENRPPLPDNDQAYKDDVAPDGSPYRPLYDGKIMFNGQPIALVVAETLEIARFAASLVRVEYETQAHVTDVYRQRDAAVPGKAPTNPMEAMFAPPKTRGTPDQALAAARGAP